MIVKLRLDERMHDLDRTGHPVVVFVVGFRVLTSDSRRAIRRLSERLGITPVPLESMIDQLGKPPVMSICVTGAAE